jgi:anaerobic ribonucleoside-triphosphate reductase
MHSAIPVEVDFIDSGKKETLYMNRPSIIESEEQESDTIHRVSLSVQIRNEERTECEIWSRVMGYHRPINSYNTGKASEYRDRVPFEDTRLCIDD